MAATLYTRDLLRLAAELAESPRLTEADGSAERTARPCGSRVVADVRVDADGRVTAFGAAAQACALGQASAALLARSIVGADATGLAEARGALEAFLTADAAPPWPGFAALDHARAATARHAAILLPFDAALAALHAASASRKAATSAS